jgi:hypothetical protein
MDGFIRERRKYPRFELDLEVKYKIISCEEAFKFTQTRNISAEDLCFEAGEHLNMGSYVEMEVDLKDNRPPVSIVAEIRWSAEVKKPGSKDKAYANGVKILSMPPSDEARFLKYYCDKMVEKLSAYLNKE